MTAYYNEIDPYAAQWLRNLIQAGHIAPGDVDQRSIADVSADDLRPYRQCHFFAGIGVWSHALRLSGWPDDRPVWTGSCPCQPFSVAGKGEGQADDRHLWPVWFNLIEQCRPPVVFGEQVEAAIRHGWLDLVQGDLEGIGYASGAVCIPAGSVGAPHIRQRLWFVAHASSATGQWDTRGFSKAQAGERGAYRDQYGHLPVRHSHGGSNGELAHATHKQHDGTGATGPGRRFEYTNGSAVSGMADSQHNDGRADEPWREPQKRITDGMCGANGELDDANIKRRPSDSGTIPRVLEGKNGVISDGGATSYRAGPTDHFWRDADWLFCRDGKWRPVEPGTFPLAYGASARVGRLRAYGNAIVPQVAQEVIQAFMEYRP